MPNFQPDQVNFQDQVGYGAWQDGHAREHIAFVQAFAGQTPAVLIPDYDFLSFLTAGEAGRAAVQTHYDSHLMLRQQAGITGTDLSQLSLQDEVSFYQWMGDHASEHAQIRQFLGMT